MRATKERGEARVREGEIGCTQAQDRCLSQYQPLPHERTSSSFLEADILRTAMLPLVVRGPWTKVQGSHGGLRGPHAMGPSHGAAIVSEVEQAWVHVWVAGSGPIRGTRVHAPIQCLLRLARLTP